DGKNFDKTTVATNLMDGVGIEGAVEEGHDLNVVREPQLAQHQGRQLHLRAIDTPVAGAGVAGGINSARRPGGESRLCQPHTHDERMMPGLTLLVVAAGIHENQVLHAVPLRALERGIDNDSPPALTPVAVPGLLPFPTGEVDEEVVVQIGIPVAGPPAGVAE